MVQEIYLNLNPQRIGSLVQIRTLAYISFIQGCPKALNELLRALQVTSSLDVYGLFQAAEQYDQVYHFKPDSKSQVGSGPGLTQSSVVAAQLRSVEPKAMDLENLRLEINALSNEIKGKAVPADAPYLVSGNVPSN
ncbi:hypothetical protein BGZ98_001053 [Dissophora globulifera]|nr:hypothetical protein BGZ98_001053 [Dissophora globulifera]